MGFPIHAVSYLKPPEISSFVKAASVFYSLVCLLLVTYILVLEACINF